MVIATIKKTDQSGLGWRMRCVRGNLLSTIAAPNAKSATPEKVPGKTSPKYWTSGTQVIADDSNASQMHKPQMLHANQSKRIVPPASEFPVNHRRFVAVGSLPRTVSRPGAGSIFSTYSLLRASLTCNTP